MKDAERELVILGAGGHAASVADAALSAGYKIYCFLDPYAKKTHTLGIPILPNPEVLSDIYAYDFCVAIGDNAERAKICQAFCQQYPRATFPPIIHRTATISPFAIMESGVIVMAQAAVGPGSILEQFALLNTQSSLDHHCYMKSFSSLAPGCIIGGEVSIGTRTAVGIGAVIQHGVCVGDDCVVGANSYLNKDLPNNQLVYGTPAKIIRQHATGETYL